MRGAPRCGEGLACAGSTASCSRSARISAPGLAARILMLTDENDCSLRPGPETRVFRRKTSCVASRGTSMCQHRSEQSMLPLACGGAGTARVRGHDLDPSAWSGPYGARGGSAADALLGSEAPLRRGPHLSDRALRARRCASPIQDGAGRRVPDPIFSDLRRRRRRIARSLAGLPRRDRGRSVASRSPIPTRRASCATSTPRQLEERGLWDLILG